MQIDPETIRWLISGLFFLMVGGISYVWKRELGQAKRTSVEGDKVLDDKIAVVVRTLEQHDARLDNNLSLINEIKQDFVSKTELEKQLNIQLSPIRDDMRELKGDVKSLLQRP